MDCVVGIDLGSTTTKAVVMDYDQRVLGRGITNTRNNYGVACTVARNEAFVSAKFSLVREAVSQAPALAGVGEAWLDVLERHFRCAQYVDQLRGLTVALDAAIASRYFKAHEAALRPVITTLSKQLIAEAPDLYADGAKLRSDFFRDIAQARYMSMAETAAIDAEIAYELLVGLFDKAILSVENEVHDLSFERHVGDASKQALAELTQLSDTQRGEAQKVVQEVAARALNECNTVGTGYGRTTLPFPKEQIRSEILCHGLGAHSMFPNTRTVLDIGGQDTKAIQVDDEGIVTSFQMNDRCAAGCGRYLGYIADEMNLGLHELGPLAQKSHLPVKISSTCTVFAGAEIRDRLALGQKREDILAGLPRSIILRAMSLLARSGGVDDEFTFTGGVAKNPAAVAALRQLVIENYGERTLNISPDSIFTGAVGAAIFGVRARDAAPEPEGSVA
jgi:benzoyl-CoA reductase subunit A